MDLPRVRVFSLIMVSKGAEISEESEIWYVPQLLRHDLDLRMVYRTLYQFNLCGFPSHTILERDLACQHSVSPKVNRTLKAGINSH